MNKHDVSRSRADQPSPGPGRAGPLAELRVLDLTHMLAGPYCTWLLGALGAQVTKVEMPGRGDFTRGVAPFIDDQSVYFMSVNRNKRSVTLNLKQPLARAARVAYGGPRRCFRRKQSSRRDAAPRPRLPIDRQN